MLIYYRIIIYCRVVVMILFWGGSLSQRIRRLNIKKKKKALGGSLLTPHNYATDLLHINNIIYFKFSFWTRSH